MLSNEWVVPDFYPIDWLPNGVRLTAYGGGAADLPAPVLQEFLDDVAAGRLAVPLARTYALDAIAQAHDDMEHDRVASKLVVLP
jgi:NADPH:quinone reductase-like Zn-dependent oxidoreductase